MSLYCNGSNIGDTVRVAFDYQKYLIGTEEEKEVEEKEEEEKEKKEEEEEEEEEELKKKGTGEDRGKHMHTLTQTECIQSTAMWQTPQAGFWYTRIGPQQTT